MTLVMAGFTPNAVHPHRGRSASCFASKAACTGPPCLGPKPGAASPHYLIAPGASEASTRSSQRPEPRSTEITYQQLKDEPRKRFPRLGAKLLNTLEK